MNTMNSYNNFYDHESSVDFPEETFYNTSEVTEPNEYPTSQPQPISQPIFEEITIAVHIGSHGKTRTFPHVQVSIHELSNLDANKIVEEVLEQDPSINFEGAQISVLMPSQDIWLQLGQYPFKDVKLNVNNLYKKGGFIYVDIKLKYPEENYTVQPSSTFAFNSTEDSLDSEDCDKRRHRHKERMIGEACDLVFKWRSFYNGVHDPITGEVIKMGLEEGARKLCVAKKSLDDYLLMIKHAKERGFDFQKHAGDRFGILRNFVKEQKELEKRKQKISEQFDDEDDKKVKKVKKSKIVKSK